MSKPKSSSSSSFEITHNRHDTRFELKEGRNRWIKEIRRWKGEGSMLNSMFLPVTRAQTRKTNLGQKKGGNGWKAILVSIPLFQVCGGFQSPRARKSWSGRGSASREGERNWRGSWSLAICHDRRRERFHRLWETWRAVEFPPSLRSIHPQLHCRTVTHLKVRLQRQALCVIYERFPRGDIMQLEYRSIAMNYDYLLIFINFRLARSNDHWNRE